MTTTLEKVRRAMDRAWLDAIEQCEREDKPSYPRNIIRSHLARAAIQALMDHKPPSISVDCLTQESGLLFIGKDESETAWGAWLQAILDEQKETAPQ